MIYRKIFAAFLVAVLLFSCKNTTKQANTSSFADKREEMVKNLQQRGIKNHKILAALMKVERHKFVNKELIEKAYEDYPLPIGEGQAISQPYIVALMTDMLDLDKTKKVLEIGTGSGYQAAVLAELCKHVYTIEIYPNLSKNAQQIIQELGYKNIDFKIGDGYLGWSENAPFDAIIVTCAPAQIPKPLQEQLAEGGKMLIPVGQDFSQDLYLLTKKNGEIKQDKTIQVRFVPMVKEDGGKH